MRGKESEKGGKKEREKEDKKGRERKGKGDNERNIEGKRGIQRKQGKESKDIGKLWESDRFKEEESNAHFNLSSGLYNTNCKQKIINLFSRVIYV